MVYVCSACNKCGMSELCLVYSSSYVVFTFLSLGDDYCRQGNPQCMNVRLQILFTFPIFNHDTITYR